MKLPQKFSRFTDVLLIAAGKQDAAFYKTEKDGTIDKIESFKIPRPKYSDNEGIFQKSVHGRIQSGSVEINDAEPIVRNFIHEFKKRAKNIHGTFSAVHIFAPANTKNKIKNAIPQAWKKNVKTLKEGNYMNESPMALLRKIYETEIKPFSPRTKKEGKILRKIT